MMNKKLFFTLMAVILSYVAIYSFNKKEILEIEKQAKDQGYDYSFLKGVSVLYILKGNPDDFQMGGKSITKWIEEGTLKKDSDTYKFRIKLVNSFYDGMIEEFTRLMKKKNISVETVENDKLPKDGIVLYLQVYSNDQKVTGLVRYNGSPIIQGQFISSITTIDKNKKINDESNPIQYILNSVGDSFDVYGDAGEEAGEGYYQIFYYFITGLFK